MEGFESRRTLLALNLGAGATGLAYRMFRNGFRGAWGEYGHPLWWK